MGEPGTQPLAGPLDAVVCHGCGEHNPERARFCLGCGTQLRTAQAPVADVRKTVSIVFADLAGYTALAERLDPESMRQIMGGFYAAMRAALDRHGGRVEKFIGDAVMAVFGAPVVREDDALRAVRATVAMRDALRALNIDVEARWSVRLGLRIGVNTGEVVVGRDGLVLGDAVNVAARLEQAAAADEVLVGAQTWRLVRDHGRFADAGPLQLKGKAETVPAFRLLGLDEDEEARGAERPLVGRAAELRRLLDAYERAVEARRPQLVTVLGAPGVGKSRLADALVAAVGGEARVVRVPCAPSDRNLTLVSIAAGLRSMVDVREDAGVAAVEAALEAALGTASDAERLLATLGGVLAGTAATADETFWAVRRALEVRAAEAPVVVLFEDVHWASTQLLDLVDHLAGWAEDAPLLLLALARPEVRVSRPALGRAGGLVADAIQLGPLDEDAARELLAGVPGAAGLAPAHARQVLDASAGNPLFLAEMVRAVVEDGPQAAPPPSIQALLATRLERLAAPERLVLERAAVIGRQFSRAAVAALVDRDVAGGLDGHLDALCRRELLEPDEATGELRFHHALVRDAAYAMLLKQTRAELHAAHAAWLEQRERPAEQLDVVGYHLEQAHAQLRSLGPLDAAGLELEDRAATALAAAGRRALARDDVAAARDLLARVLVVRGDPDGTRAAALAELAEAELADGALDEAVRTIAELRTLAGDDRRLVAEVQAAEAELALLRDGEDLAGAVRRAGEAATSLIEAGDRRGASRALAVMARGLEVLGRSGDAEQAASQALAIARSIGDERRETAVLSLVLESAIWGALPVTAAVGRFLDVGRMTAGRNRRVHGHALRSLAVLDAMRGRGEQARVGIDRARALAEELGLEVDLLRCAEDAGYVELLAGDPQAAERHLRLVRAGCHRVGLRAERADAWLAAAVLAQGRLEEAERLARATRAGAGGDVRARTWAATVLVVTLLSRGLTVEAVDVARGALDGLGTGDFVVERAEGLLALALALRAGGEHDAAREAASDAAARFARKEHRVGLARVRAAFADLDEGRIRDPAERRPAPSEEPTDDAVVREHRRFLAEYCRRWSAHEFDAMAADLLDPDVAFLDHRGIGAEHAHGADSHLALYYRLAEMAPDAALDGTVPVAHGRFSVHSNLIRGTIEGGGPMQAELWLCAEVVDHRLVRCDIFSTETPARRAFRARVALDAAVDAGTFPGLQRDPVEFDPTGDTMIVAFVDGRRGHAVLEADRLVRVDPF